MNVEVVLAWPQHYDKVELELPVGATVADAIQAADIAGKQEASGIAVFGVLVTLKTVLNEGDRIELLRPLLIDPKEARRRRAAKL